MGIYNTGITALKKVMKGQAHKDNIAKVNFFLSSATAPSSQS